MLQNILFTDIFKSAFLIIYTRKVDVPQFLWQDGEINKLFLSGLVPSSKILADLQLSKARQIKINCYAVSTSQ